MTKVPGGDLVRGISSSTTRKHASLFPLGSYFLTEALGEPEETQWVDSAGSSQVKGLVGHET